MSEGESFDKVPKFIFLSNEEERAREAFSNLHYLFFSHSPLQSPEEDMSAIKRIIRTVGAYRELSVRAAEGITPDQRDNFIKNGLKADALIDPYDPVCANQKYRIISEGYELNKPYWDNMLGQMRNFRNVLKARGAI